MIKIFKPNDTNFASNGDICINPKNCIETKRKSLNGWFLNIEVDIQYKEYIKKDYLVVVQTKSSLNPQAFRIADDENDNTIQYTDNSIIFKANHVYNDSKRYILLDVRPTNLNATSALSYINERTDVKSPFSVNSNIDDVISTSYFIRKNLLEAWEVLEERYSGVFDFDNWNVKLLSHIGNDTGLILAYGQKLQGFKVYEDWSNVTTKIYPVGQNGLMLDEKFLLSDVKYDVPYTRIQNFSTDLEEDNQTDENLKKELRSKAQSFLDTNKYPLISYEITSDIDQSLDIGDIVHIKHPLADIKVEVVEYTYNHVQKQITSLVFGNFIRDVKSKFNAIKQEIINQSERLTNQEKVIIKQTELINALNKNGIIYIDENELCVLDTVPKEQAKNVWRLGMGGFGFSSNGYEGPFETAITQDGSINANFISSGKINTNLIEGYDQLTLEVKSQSTTITELDKKIDNIEVGGRNLLLKSDTVYSNNNYNIAQYKMSEKMVKGETYSIRIWGELGEGKETFLVFLNGTSTLLAYCTKKTDDTYSLTFTGQSDDKFSEDTLWIFAYPSTTSNVTSTIQKIKLERGNKFTDWTPAPEDINSEINEANDRSKENSNSITKLQETDVELKLGLDNIDARVQTTETITQGLKITDEMQGNELVLKDSAGMNVLDLRIDGNTKQDSREGINQLMSFEKDERSYFRDITDITNSDTYFYKATPLEENWIKFECDMTGFTESGAKYINTFINADKIPNLKPSTEYTIVCEFRNVNITALTEGLFIGKTAAATDLIFDKSITYTSSDIETGLKKLVCTTYDELPNNHMALRNFVGLRAGDKFSFELRVSVLEGDWTNKDYTYEPYGASPSPEFPSDIKNVEPVQIQGKDGYWLPLKITGKNLFVNSDNFEDVHKIGNIDNENTLDNSYSIMTGSAWQGPYLDLEALTKKHHLKVGDKVTYSIYFKTNFVPTTDMQFTFYRSTAQEGNLPLKRIEQALVVPGEWQRLSFTIELTDYSLTSSIARIEADYYDSNSGDYSFGNSHENKIWFAQPQFETGELTDYEPYKEKEFLFDMNKYDEEGNITGYYELSKANNVKDDVDFISGILNKRIGKYVCTGEEKVTYGDTTNRVFYITDIINALPYDTHDIAKIDMYCTHFKKGTGNIYNCSVGTFWYHVSGKHLRFVYPLETSVDTFKQFLKEQYNAGTPVTIYYELETPEQIQLQPTDVELFEGYNRITLFSDLGTEMYCRYVRQNDIQDVYQSKEGMNDYYNRVETDTRIQLSADSIKNSVEEVKTLVDENGQSIAEVKNQVEQTITSTNAQLEIINETLENGVTKLKNMLVTVDIDGMKVATDLSKVSTLISNNQFSIRTNSGDYLAFFGYDEAEKKSKAQMDNLLVTNYFTAGYHRIEKFTTDEGEKRTGHFYNG